METWPAEWSWAKAPPPGGTDHFRDGFSKLLGRFPQVWIPFSVINLSPQACRLISTVCDSQDTIPWLLFSLSDHCWKQCGCCMPHSPKFWPISINSRLLNICYILTNGERSRDQRGVEWKTRQRHGLCFQGACSLVEERGLVMWKDDQQHKVTYRWRMWRVGSIRDFYAAFSEKTKVYFYLCPENIIN